MDCWLLETVYSEIEEPFKLDRVFDNSGENLKTLYVPVGTKALYEATKGWNVFQNIVEMEDQSGIAHTYSERNVNKTAFNLSGQRVANPSKGLFIINGHKVVK